MSEVKAEMAATVWQVSVAVGDVVAVGDMVVILESMKMEIPVLAPSAGTVVAVAVKAGQTVQRGDELVDIE